MKRIFGQPTVPRRRRLLLTLVLCVSAVLFGSVPSLGGHQPGSVLAQEPEPSEEGPVLSDLELSFWPEFDRPEMLVMYRGLFAAGTRTPVPVEVRIPVSVGPPTAVAYVDESGQRLNQEHTTHVDGDQLVVAFELPTLGFQLEYYDSLPIDSAGQRAFTYTYTADYPITALRLEFQVPPTAQAFTLDPLADSVVPESDGLTYHLVQAGSVAQGETRQWEFTYQKADSELTVSAFLEAEAPAQLLAAGQPAPSAVEAADKSNAWVFLLALAALVAVGAGAFWLGRRSEQPPVPGRSPRLSSGARRGRRRGSGKSPQPRKDPPTSSPQALRTTSRPQETSAPGRDETLFCYECGAQLPSESDYFLFFVSAVRRE